MGSEIKEVILEQANGTIVQTTEQSNGLISNLLKKFTENKMYIYIAIGVVILAVVAFYYLKKCKKDVNNSNKNTLLPIPKQNYESSITGLNNDDHSYAKEWNDDYKLDLIGREYCRDRQIGCSKEEFDTLMIWQVAKSKLIQCHTKWIESIFFNVLI